MQKMNNVKNIFSIKDLENISGIKAHTIRIWEKRYNVLAPMRSDTNIRYYDLPNLQKLLNITLLHDHGYKISRIAKIAEEKIPDMVREIITEKSVKNHAISSFKIAMMNFDQTLFFNTYNELLAKKSFREVFYEVIIPLMNEIGLLWQTDTITPAHEHFITYLIKQKLLINTEKLQVLEPTKTDKVFVLYLPSNEIHELGIMYLNYEVLFHGYKTIYLGESIPLESLIDVKKYFDTIVFISYLTVEPNKDEINAYIAKMNAEVVSDNQTQLWLLGRMVQFIDPKLIQPNTTLFNSIDGLVANL
jgi:DNA-binding transcriptional MerR regulator